MVSTAPHLLLTGQTLVIPLTNLPTVYTDKHHVTEGRSTRIMIFAQYRDSVSEITEMLRRHWPLVKVMGFIGQSSGGKTTKGYTQKEQLKVTEG